MKSYKFYRDGQSYETDNLAAFCKEHGLQRRHMQEVVYGTRKSYKGFSKLAEQSAPINDPVGGEGPSDQGSRLVGDVLDDAEVAAEAIGGEHGALVQSRIDRLRSGKPLVVGPTVTLPERMRAGFEELKAKGIVQGGFRPGSPIE